MSTRDGSTGKMPFRARAQPLSQLAQVLLDPIIARRSGMTADLVAAWPELAGHAHAPYTLPEKINWPRGGDSQSDFSPGTLVVACEGARSVYFLHELDDCLERVNAYFGFHAIDRIRLVQKPVQQRAHARPRPVPVATGEAAAKLEKVLGEIEDERLRESLRKLGNGVYSRRGKS